jgi:hypothetical protein
MLESPRVRAMSAARAVHPQRLARLAVAAHMRVSAAATGHDAVRHPPGMSGGVARHSPFTVAPAGIEPCVDVKGEKKRGERV